MIHQPMGGAQGQADDIRIQADEILRMKMQLNKILSKNTGQALKKSKLIQIEIILCPQLRQKLMDL